MAASLPAINGGGATVIGAYVAAIVRALEARGVATSAILEAAGLPRVPSNDPLDRVPLATLQQLLDAAVTLTDDPYFGLYAAKFLHPSNLHALGYALLASGSLRELCTRLARHFRLLSTTVAPRLIETDAGARLEFIRLTDNPALGDDIFGLFLVNLINELSDAKIRPLAIDLHRSTPADGGSRHRRAFGCPLSFDAPYVTMLFDAGALDQPLSGANHELAQYNEQIAVGYLAKFDHSDIETRVRALVQQQLPLGTLTKEHAARQLHMSPHTLQIRLSKGNTTFQAVVNETRRALACMHLQNSALSITEVAYMLGFTDTSNFSRAFRRWTGFSPSGYAAQLRNAASPTPP